MSEPREGNRADELAQHEQGADWSTVGTSSAPVSPLADIDVELSLDQQGNLILSPKRATAEGGIGDFRESEKDQLAAQIFDDPAMASRLSGDVERAIATDRGRLQFFAYTKHYASACFGDRVMVMRDTMESIYGCRFCKGKGHSEITCPTCKGTRIDIDGTSDCRSCQVLGYDREVKHACGYTRCTSCHGAGSAGGIVLPDSVKQSPISGIVVSVGPQCVNLRLGDRVLHSRYAGHTKYAPDGEVFTVMLESEVLELLKEL
jgi:chaperonin GroES